MTITESPPTTVDPTAADDLDHEATIASMADDEYVRLVERLSRQSVEKHYNPFVDIDWDSPEFAIDQHDPRWIEAAAHIFGETAWFHTLTPETQAELGLYRVATAMKVGLEFENVLKRGLLEYTFKLPNNSPEFRYLYHETIEEAYHGMMFQEFVNRSALPIPGMPRWMRFGSRQVVGLARSFPPLFFLFVLGGEDPIDHQQRKWLRQGGNHPLVERIMRIHVTEEARHLSFARHHLKRTVPQMGRFARFRLSIAAPILLGVMARQMLMPSGDLIRRFDIPAETVGEITSSERARAEVRESLHKVRKLCVDLGLVTWVSKPLWRRAGIWEQPAAD